MYVKAHVLHIFSPQVNVYILGKTFLLLARELCINAPAVGKLALCFTHYRQGGFFY